MKDKQISLGEEEASYTEAKNKILDALKVRSRTYLGLCKNDDCFNLRRKKSAYCIICSHIK